MELGSLSLMPAVFSAAILMVEAHVPLASTQQMWQDSSSVGHSHFLRPRETHTVPVHCCGEKVQIPIVLGTHLVFKY